MDARENRNQEERKKEHKKERKEARNRRKEPSKEQTQQQRKQDSKIARKPGRGKQESMKARTQESKEGKWQTITLCVRGSLLTT
jgi:hypothetical protein